MSNTLTIALNKGRILKETLPLLAAAGIEPLEDIGSSRQLIFPTTADAVRLVVVRGSDVPTFVEHGAAQLGVTGKDTLLEHGGEGLYEPLDLGISKCRLMTAGPVDAPAPAAGERLRVASKFPRITRAWYARQGRQVELIKLGGAMELAPLIGLADEIVDIVDTGNTLKANGLAPRALIADISSRLVVNPAAMKVHRVRIRALLETLAAAVARRDAGAAA